MCGICGVFNYAGTKSLISEELIDSMSSEMRHRGPDDDGLFLSPDKKIGLGFRRLSIIDIAGGHQPMANEDGSVWIVFNGEIYNHQELRRSLEAKGHVYKTQSDTESIIHLYEEKGVRCVDDLHGMFAFAIWDSRKRRLFLARDRIGIKPLYYTFKDGALVFASEIKSILKSPGIKRDINPAALYHYLSFVTAPAPMTLFDGISKLEPATFMTVDEGGNVNQEQYWDPLATAGEARDMPDEYYVERLRELLSESIKQRMMSDVPVGVFLSGGLDSSSNVAYMAEMANGPVSTFTIGFKGYEDVSDLLFARDIAKEFNTDHHELMIDQNDVMECIPNIIHHQDEPIADAVCIPMYHLAKLARESGVPVIQVGEGSDEIFAGYVYYKNMLNLHRGWKHFARLPTPLKKGAYSLSGPLLNMMGPRLKQGREYIRRAADGEEFFWGGGGGTAFFEPAKKSLLTKEFIRSLNGISSHDVIGPHFETMAGGASTLDLLQQFCYLELKIRLAEMLLMRVDKMTMASSVEARVPYLDHKLVEFAVSLPIDQKIRGDQLKYVLRQASAGVVPKSVIQREKLGFWLPMQDWLMNDLKGYAGSVLSESGLWQRGIFNNDFISSLMRQHQTGKVDNSYQIWPLMNLALWHRYWIEGREL